MQKARTIPCPRCGKTFFDKHGLSQHTADVHKAGKRPRAPERYPFELDFSGEYAPRRFAVGAREEDFKLMSKKGAKP